MSHDHAALYRRWINDLWNGPADLESLRAAAHDLVADGFTGHWPRRTVTGPDKLAAVVLETKSMFPAMIFRIVVGPFAGGGFVAGRWTGDDPRSASGESFYGNDILRVSGEKFAEYWVATGQA